MKKLFAICIIIIAGAYFWGTGNALIPTKQESGYDQNHSEAGLARAIAERRNNFQVQGRGEVIRLLSDDNEGSRHQRFIIELTSGQTLLVAHNIDLAKRLNSLKPGDTIEFNGEYEWNARGGVIHWTHHDPKGKHEPGWLKHKGVTYQ